jgi:hypothetical protein
MCGSGMTRSIVVPPEANRSRYFQTNRENLDQMSVHASRARAFDQIRSNIWEASPVPAFNDLSQRFEVGDDLPGFSTSAPVAPGRARQVEWAAALRKCGRSFSAIFPLLQQARRNRPAGNTDDLTVGPVAFGTGEIGDRIDDVLRRVAPQAPRTT